MVFISILLSQLGGGLVLGFGVFGKPLPITAEWKAAIRKKLLWVELPLGLLAILTGLAMLMVRAQALGIFG